MKQYHIFVKGGFVGTTLATLDQIKAAFPWSTVFASRVDVFAMKRA